MVKVFGKSAKAVLAMKRPPVQSMKTPKLGPRVLLIDDDVTIRELGRTLLRQAGFEIEVLDHGPTDHQFYSGLNIDAAIIDLGLPGLNGADVIANLRAIPKNAQLPIVICTGSADVETIHACYIQHDALTVVQKPVDWPSMISLLNGAVRNRRSS